MNRTRISFRTAVDMAHAACSRALLLSLIVVTFIVTASQPCHAEPSQAIRLDSPEGHLIFSRSATPQSLALLVNFETQATIANCGLASAVMVLNSLTLEAPEAFFPRAYNYFTQQNFFSSTVEKIVPASAVARRGMTLEELASSISAWGPKAEAVRFDHGTVAAWRTRVTDALERGNFVISNYDRAKMKQNGRGHHSPIAAYDQESDRFLLLDVARYAYPALWVEATDLLEAIAEPSNGGEARGVVIIDHPWKPILGLSR